MRPVPLRIRRALRPAILALVAACHPPTPAPLPARELPAQAPCSGLQRVDPALVETIFVQPRQLGAISPEAGPLAIFDTVGVTTRGGGLHYTDLPHGNSGSQVFSHCKLDLASLDLRPISGGLDESLQFTPARDVLRSLDAGFGAVLRTEKVVEHVVFAPWYESAAYAPFDRGSAPTPSMPAGERGQSGGVAPAGAAGEPGEAGEPGLPGQRGGDGTTPGMAGGNGGRGGDGGRGPSGAAGSDEGGAGEPGGLGGDGARGGDGGHGRPGGTGEDGQPGLAGDAGPRLDVRIRPVQSPFYPGERLVYIEVLAQWSGRQPSREERRNYILHEGERFRFRSQGAEGGAGGAGGVGGAGGRGGAGGAGGNGGDGGRGGSGGGTTPTGPGGAGGDGGDGGDGGAGGRGAPGGCGGSGGAGGRGGDGGTISVQLSGPADFREAVRRSLRFESLPGAGGLGGAAGDTGGPGTPGAGGAGGLAGLGGTGGTGVVLGPSGADGSLGRAGAAAGPTASPLCSVRAGEAGRSGQPRGVRMLEAP